MRRRNRSIYVERLETRVVPTALIGSPVARIAATSVVGQSAVINEIKHVFGSIHGTYQTPNSFGPGVNVDGGITNEFTGHGTLPTFGAVKLSGTLQGTGNVLIGQASGELTLTTSVGSVTLQLIGPDQGMFAPLPKSFHFSVISGTGDFAHLQMTGTINLEEHARAKTFTMTFVSVQLHDTEPLVGTGTGHYSTHFGVDAGPSYNLNGTASLELLGQVNVTGWVQGNGFVTSGQATGIITLSNKQGSVTLSLTGPVQSGFSPLPGQFQLHVLRATGDFVGLNISATFELKLHQTVSPLTSPSHAAGKQPPPSIMIAQGEFSFSITSNRVISNGH